MQKHIDRRLFLSMIAGVVALPGVAHAVPAPPTARRRLRLVNAHTGETFAGTYRDDTGPIPTAMADLSTFLRDFHSAAKIDVDVGVIDFLAAVMDAVDAQTATVLSAYRTRETNAILARTTFGVAENSQHLYGRALDVHLGTRLADAMGAARAMQRGGVGWYPRSGFLHLDTGPVRNWDLGEDSLVSLLSKGRRPRSDNNKEHDNRFLPEVARRSRLMPEMLQRGRLVPEMEQRGRLLPEIKPRGGRLSEMARRRLALSASP